VKSPRKVVSGFGGCANRTQAQQGRCKDPAANELAGDARRLLLPIAH
jgi:hypothetical protein